MSSSDGISNPCGDATTEAERRRTPRLHNAVPLRIEGLAAIVEDVSRSGICVSVREPLVNGARHRLILRDTLNDSCQEMEAEVVWTAAGRAGLRWTALTPAQDRWLFQRMLQWLRTLEDAPRH